MKNTTILKTGLALAMLLAAGLTGAAVVAPAAQTVAESPCIAGVVPGLSSREDVLDVLGQPKVLRIEKDLGELLEYESWVEEMPDTVIIQDGKVALVGVLADEDGEALADLKARFGEPEQAVFSYLMQGLRTYLYPQQGFAAVVSEEDGEVLWKQCFTPMPLADYLKGWGSELPLEDPYIR
jgi:hypothetical protein